MLALVTGATGFVGSHLVERLLAEGRRVRCTVRRTSDPRWLAGKPVEAVEGDLRDGRGLDRAMDAVDVVFHVAGVVMAPSPEQYRAGNWLASKRMIEAAVAAGVRRFVHVSSLAAAGPSPNGTPVDEERPCAPISVYGRSKRDGEQEAWKHRHEIALTVVRPPAVYGPRDRGLLDLYRTVNWGLCPAIGGRKFVSIVHVDDLVEGILRAGTDGRAVGQVFYLCNTRAHEMGELMELIRAALGRRALRVRIPDRVVRFLGGVAEDALALVGRRSMFNRDKVLEMTQRAWTSTPEKAKRLLDWEARIPVERGLRETIQWCRREGWL